MKRILALCAVMAASFNIQAYAASLPGKAVRPETKTAAVVTEADFEKRMARGTAALEAGDNASAVAEFRAAVAARPDDTEAALSLAIALNRSGDPAAESALKNALRLDPGNQRLNFELGTYYYNHEMPEEAADYFDNLLALKPDAEMKTVAEKYLANIRSQQSGKRWGISLLAGTQFDSNVPLAANGVQLPVGVSRKGDWRGVLNLGLTGVAYRSENQELTGSYSLYQTLHSHLSDFNLTQNLLDVAYRRKISPTLAAKLSGGFEDTMLGGNPFVNGFNVSPGILITRSNGSILALDYKLKTSSFKNSDSYPTNSDRNSITHSAILTYNMAVSETLSLHFGYTFERELASVSAWGSTAHLGTAGFAVTLPNNVVVNASLEGATRTYDDILAPATEARSDITITQSASLTWPFSEHLGASIGYSLTSNTSNTTGYEYSRSITSVMFQGRY